jgi:cytochrome c
MVSASPRSPARAFVQFGTVGVVAMSIATLAMAVTQRAADPDKGKGLFEKCAACHAVGEDAMTDGPSLKGLFGRKAGSREDYRYSAAMKRSEVVWSAETLDAYITDPQGYIRGNRMAFAGMSDKQERDDLIAYIEQATK